MRTPSKNCEQTLQKLRTNRIMNKRAFPIYTDGKLWLGLRHHPASSGRCSRVPTTTSGTFGLDSRESSFCASAPPSTQLPSSSRLSQPALSRESLNGGFPNGGLRYSSTIVHDFLQLSSFCHENSLYKRPRKCTIAHDCAQIAESGLKPPFESPHLDFSDYLLLYRHIRNYYLSNSKIYQDGSCTGNSGK